MAVAPFPLSIIVCDQIHSDPSTGKKTILGIFSAIGAVEFPCKHPRMGVFIELTGGHGRFPFEFKIVDCNEEFDPLFQAFGDIEFSDPRAVLEMGFEITNLEFRQPGEYRCQVFANNEFLIERRLLVQQIPTEQIGK